MGLFWWCECERGKRHLTNWNNYCGFHFWGVSDVIVIELYGIIICECLYTLVISGLNYKSIIKDLQYWKLENQIDEANTLVVGHQAVEQKKGTNMVNPACWLEVVFGLQCRDSKPKQSLVVSLSWGNWSSQGPRWLKFTGQSTRKKAVQRESSGDQQRAPLSIFGWIVINYV